MTTAPDSAPTEALSSGTPSPTAPAAPRNGSAPVAASPANAPTAAEESAPTRRRRNTSSGGAAGADPGADLPPPLRADSPLEAAVTTFGEFMLRKGFSENTIKAFNNDLKIISSYLGPETRLAQIGTADLNDFLNWLQNERGKPCSAKTLARRITTLKVFF
ncbi:MAG: site-specific integrase, partial [Caldilineaceae bacterium]